MASKRNRVDFDETGIILARDEKLTDYIKKHAGAWKAEIAMPGILLLRKGEGETAGTLLSGEIKREGWLNEIIGLVCTSRLTGKLTVVSRDVRRELYFDSGSLRLASSTARGDLLGEFILSEGLITKEQLDSALKEQGPGRRLGQVLVDKGFLSRHDIYTLLNKKIEKIFLDAIALREGVYTLDEDIELSKLPASISIDTKALLTKGLEKRDEHIYYRETVPRPGKLLGNSPNVIENCSSTEKEFVVHVDGIRTLADIDEILHLGDFETVRIARQLVEKGLVEVILDRRSGDEALRSVVDDFNEAIHLIYLKVRTKVTVEELTDLGQEFLNKSTKHLTEPDKITLKKTGELDQRNLERIFKSTDEKDGLNFIVMILSRYISFFLFTANSYLTVDEQSKLSEKVYGKLEPYS